MDACKRSSHDLIIRKFRNNDGISTQSSGVATNPLNIMRVMSFDF